jgi:hypothetical protein
MVAPVGPRAPGPTPVTLASRAHSGWQPPPAGPESGPGKRTRPDISLDILGYDVLGYPGISNASGQAEISLDSDSESDVFLATSRRRAGPSLSQQIMIQLLLYLIYYAIILVEYFNNAYNAFIIRVILLLN